MSRTFRAALLILLASTGSANVSAADLLIAVAANFTDTAGKLVAQFEASSGHRVRASFGSTGKLYAQIRHGAPFEVFMAADSEHPRLLEAEGRGVATTRFTYATGKLVLWSRNADTLADPLAYLTASGPDRVAIGNPKTAPYGIAAMETLAALGLTGPISKRLVRGDSIAQTFQFVATGNADAGFVALAQVRAWQGEPGSLWLVPQELYRPIRQQAILLSKGADNPAARAWLAFLASPPARAIIAKDGYDSGQIAEP